MHPLIKLLFISLFLMSQGCQSLNAYMPDLSSQDSIVDQQQLTNLILQGMQYQELNKQQQKARCITLKQKYQQRPEWQTAWLLVYSLNSNLRCLSLNKTLGLMKTIQNMPSIHPQVLWLNKYQIQLIKTLKQSNNNLKNQLNETERQLQQVISKIQALKAIETNINKKLDHKYAN